MKKLINGIVEFRQKVRPNYKETFARLAVGQSPDCLFIACSDSRVVPNTFASTDPGDLFVVRNVGNMIPACDVIGHSTADESEGAAIEFALEALNVHDIIICGHSECGAMQALLRGRGQLHPPHLREWLRHGEISLDLFSSRPDFASGLAPHNRLSQLNVLAQLQQIATYQVVRERVARGELRLHGWWFDLANAEVCAYDEDRDRFVVIDEEESQRMILKLGDWDERWALTKGNADV